MLLKDRINELKDIDYKNSKKVFTLYLNTDARSPEQQKGEWKIHLKNMLKEFVDSTKKNNSPEEKQQAKAIQEKVEKEVHEHERELLRGLILFATADEGLWYYNTLHLPVETKYHWESKPILDQLEKLEQTYPYTGIIVIQQDEVLVLETEIGTLVDQTHYKLDLNTDDWREHSGPQGDELTQGGQKRDEFNERVKANQQRWFKHLVATLEKKAKDKGWEHIYLVGEQNEIKPLQSYFNKSIDKMIPRNILNWNADKILAAVLEE